MNFRSTVADGSDMVYTWIWYIYKSWDKPEIWWTFLSSGNIEQFDDVYRFYKYSTSYILQEKDQVGFTIFSIQASFRQTQKSGNAFHDGIWSYFNCLCLETIAYIYIYVIYTFNNVFTYTEISIPIYFVTGGMRC